MKQSEEIAALRLENDQQRRTIDILSRDLKVHYERSRGAEYVEARAERIATNIHTALASIERFRNEIIAVLEANIRLRARKRKKKAKKKAKKK